LTATSNSPSETEHPRLILASGSPRRRELLKQIVPDFFVVPGNIEEKRFAGEGAREFVLRISRAKAEWVFRSLSLADAFGSWILAADTVVVVNGLLLGKPLDAEDARRMLNLLQGRGHEVITGICLLDGLGEVRFLDAAVTLVWMRALDKDEMEQYLLSDEPYDKAGGYAIQGWAGRFVERIEGSFSNVVGLPLREVEALLKANGFFRGAGGLDDS